MSCTAKMSYPPGWLNMKCDVYQRVQTVVSQEIVGGQSKIASNVRTRIASQTATPFASMFGATMQSTDHVAYFGQTPRIEPGYQLVIKGFTYTVRDVQRVPAAHDFSMQVCTVVPDTTSSKE